MKRLNYYLFALILSAGASTYAQDGTEENTEQEKEPTEMGSSEAQNPPPGGITVLRAEDNGGYNPLSRRPVHLSDQMFRKTVWRKLDLREKQNKPLFSSGRELSRILIDAVKAGKITPYMTDSCARPMSLEDFDSRLIIPGMDTEEEDDGFGDDAWGDAGDAWGDVAPVEEVEISPYYLENTLYVFEIKEDMIFDKQRSRMYYDILSIGLFIPADNPDNVKGIEEPVGYFRYVDLLKVFEEDPRAFWYNPANDAAHHSMADAMDLRLFSSYIIKVSNPDDAYLIDIYGSPEAGIRASYHTMYELMEYEHNLWEF